MRGYRDNLINKLHYADEKATELKIEYEIQKIENGKYGRKNKNLHRK